MTPAAGQTLYYQCQRCTNCCRWPGDVKVTEAEVGSIAAFFGIEAPAFIERYTRLRVDRRGLSLIERPDHSCIFLFFAWAGVAVFAVSLLAAAPVVNNWPDNWGALMPADATALLVGLVAATWREVRAPPTSVAPKRRRNPEDW